VALVHSIEERLDAEAVANREHRTVAAVRDHRRELPAQVASEVHPLAEVQVQRDLAVGVGLERAALGTQAFADGLVAVELAVDDELDVAAGVRHRLGTVAETDDREAGMAEEPAAVGGNPLAHRVGTPVMKRLEGTVEPLRLQRASEEAPYESAHVRVQSQLLGSSSSPIGPFLSAPRAAAGDRMRFRRRLEQPPKIRTAGSVSELPPNPCFDGQAVEVTLVLDPLDLCLVFGVGLDALRRLPVGREVLEAL
jgi:hypothetical protein